VQEKVYYIQTKTVLQLLFHDHILLIKRPNWLWKFPAALWHLEKLEAAAPGTTQQ